MYLETFDFDLRQRSSNQLRHLQSLINLNQNMSWTTKMEEILELEALERQKSVELKKTLKKTNPLSHDQIAQFDIVAYTDGACQRKNGEPLGSAAYIIFNRD